MGRGRFLRASKCVKRTCMKAGGHRRALQSGTSPLSNDIVAPTMLSAFVLLTGKYNTSWISEDIQPHNLSYYHAHESRSVNINHYNDTYPPTSIEEKATKSLLCVSLHSRYIKANTISDVPVVWYTTPARQGALWKIHETMTTSGAKLSAPRPRSQLTQNSQMPPLSA